MKIMIVDDEVDQRMLMQCLLDEWGHDVQAASNGKEALELACRHRPDVVIMDLNMPVMNGFEAARRLRGLPQLVQIHMIAISGYLHNNQEWIDRAIAAGCNTCFGKPADLKLLQAELLRVHAAGLLQHMRRNGELGADDLAHSTTSAVTAVCVKAAQASPTSDVSAQRHFSDEAEVRYWCREFGCTKQRLREAVKAVGKDAAKVRERLKLSAGLH
jgi:two-component system cell cycle response regulator DivK